MLPQRMEVRVIEAYYEADTDTVNWNVEGPDGRVYPLVWPRTKFGECFNIKGVIPVKMIEENCMKMVGKSFVHEIRMLPMKELEKDEDEIQVVRKPRVRKVSKTKKRTKHKRKR